MGYSWIGDCYVWPSLYGLVLTSYEVLEETPLATTIELKAGTHIEWLLREVPLHIADEVLLILNDLPWKTLNKYSENPKDSVIEILNRLIMPR